MANVFKFKQFEVDQEGCAMRINTDGVLLAAIAGHPFPKDILDIGTGTGVLAMMMAQRFPEASIVAVEIDEQASITAARNFNSSSFTDRINAIHTGIATYETERRYDLIISNPPFFVNDLKNPEGRKSLARHTDEAFFESLLLKAEELLTSGGLLWLILPVKQAGFVTVKASGNGLVLQREISICSDINKPVIRKIICLGRTEPNLKDTPLQEELFYIYSSEGAYTDAYKQLLKDFFLAF
ncbi:MAG TPA: methyltransferase [Pedobacter sp.]|nr:methyltransferase [Pedobacter sp.]